MIAPTLGTIHHFGHGLMACANLLGMRITDNRAKQIIEDNKSDLRDILVETRLMDININLAVPEMTRILDALYKFAADRYHERKLLKDLKELADKGVT
jgi:hypothetical protein